jgi:lysophospholipase L1-like esterase
MNEMKANNMSAAKKKCTLALCLVLLAGATFPAKVEVTPVPRQKEDTWGWWKRCGDIHNELVKCKTNSYDVVFVGDSITHLWERTVDSAGKGPYADIKREFKVLNLGFSGDRTENVIWRFRCAGQLDGYTAKVFMLMIGTNNFNSTPCKPEDVKDGVTEIIREIRTRHPESKILLLPVFVHGRAGEHPAKTSRYMIFNDSLLPALADGKVVFWHDINRDFLTPEGTIPDGLLCDGLHLTTHGYCIWRDSVLPFFRRFAKSERNGDIK